MKPVMIGQLARETSTKVTTIRFYESIGLLRSAPRTASGRRTEPPRVCRRPWVVSYAAISMMSAEA
ncbi:hypothetical protein JAGODDHD_03711 (plasmid) [Sphingomonas paucimobilis]|nr:hypothetical protein [Sphingomonas paucimobilis]